MNDYTALKMTHLRREQAARLQRNAELEADLEPLPRRPLFPSLRLPISDLLRRPLRPVLRTPFNRAAGFRSAAPPCEPVQA